MPKNFRTVPKAILSALDSIKCDFVIVAATKRIALEDIKAGAFAGMGIRYIANNIVCTAVEPAAEAGKYSARNADGWEVKRTDLPMIFKTFSWETPNFGDAATYGTHTHYQEREVYQREYHEPRNHTIQADLLSDPTKPVVLAKFSVDCILDRTRDDFSDDLLFCINLLQENAGIAGVFPSNATRQDFIGTIVLDWQIFPPGTADDVIVKAFVGVKGKLSAEEKGIIEDRVKLFSRRKPRAFLRGAGSFGAYVGALYDDDLVVFENTRYGNALYVLYDDWEEVSKRSRLDLLKGTSQNFDRFVHSEGWKERFLEHLDMELDARKRQARG